MCTGFFLGFACLHNRYNKCMLSIPAGVLLCFCVEIKHINYYLFSLLLSQLSPQLFTFLHYSLSLISFFLQQSRQSFQTLLSLYYFCFFISGCGFLLLQNLTSLLSLLPCCTPPALFHQLQMSRQIHAVTV